MRTYRVDIAVPSGFITAWQSDTIFGHLCWAAERHGNFANFKGAAGLIELFRAGDIPFVISDGFPAGLLPAPITLKGRFLSEASENLDSSSYALMKKAKKREYLTLAQFQAFQRGETPSLENESNGFVRATTLHNKISRFTNTTGDSGSLFERDEIFAPGGKVQIYAKVHEGFEDDLRLLFELMAHSGFGAKKSSGKGACSVESFELCNDFESSSKPAGFVMLSHYVPAHGDPAEGAYKTMVKYGKLGEDKTFNGNPFKKPLMMLKPGAVFNTANVKHYYGRLVENIAYTDSDVVQYGFGFALPIAGRQIALKHQTSLRNTVLGHDGPLEPVA
jgi:CRISPR-associated protein Csm4